MGDADEVAVQASVRVHRDDAQPDLVAYDDRRSGSSRERLVRRGDRAIEHGVDRRRAVAEQRAEPQGQAVDEDRLRRLGAVDRPGQVVADIDRRPLGRALGPVTPYPVVELLVADPRRREEPRPALAGQPPRGREAESALATARAAQREDQR
jgi:hypothetical protein